MLCVAFKGATWHMPLQCSIYIQGAKAKPMFMYSIGNSKHFENIEDLISHFSVRAPSSVVAAVSVSALLTLACLAPCIFFSSGRCQLVADALYAAGVEKGKARTFFPPVAQRLAVNTDRLCACYAKDSMTRFKPNFKRFLYLLRFTE